MKQVNILLFGLQACVFHFLLLGSTQASSKSYLKVEEAVKFALENNPSFQIARQARNQGQAQLVEARLPTWQNPQFGLRTARRLAPGESDSQDWGLELSHQLELGGQRDARIQVAQLEQKLLDAQLWQEARSLALATRQRFIQVQLTRLQARNAQRLLELAETFVDIARVRHEAGESTRLELNLALAELGGARAETLLAERDLQTARLQLARLLGETGSSLPALEELAPLMKELPDPQEILDEALENRPELQLARQATALGVAREEAARVRRVPGLQFQLGWEEEGAEDLLGLGVGFSLPLFQRQQGDLLSAQIQKRQGQLQEKAVAWQVRLELELARARYQPLREALRLYEEEVLLSFEENARLLNQSFQSGKIDFLRAISVQRELAELQKRHLTLQEEALLALLDWEQATGQLLPEGWDGKPPFQEKESP